MIECYTDEEFKNLYISTIKENIKILASPYSAGNSDSLKTRGVFFDNERALCLFLIVHDKFALRILSDGTIGVSSLKSSLGLKDYAEYTGQVTLLHLSCLPCSTKSWEHLLELMQNPQTYLVWLSYKDWYDTLVRHLSNLETKKRTL